nr:MAG TPA: hypothetical protein [Crassvirales sp.]
MTTCCNAYDAELTQKKSAYLRRLADFLITFMKKL